MNQEVAFNSFRREAIQREKSLAVAGMISRFRMVAVTSRRTGRWPGAEQFASGLVNGPDQREQPQHGSQGSHDDGDHAFQRTLPYGFRGFHPLMFQGPVPVEQNQAAADGEADDGHESHNGSHGKNGRNVSSSKQGGQRTGGGKEDGYDAAHQAQRYVHQGQHGAPDASQCGGKEQHDEHHDDGAQDVKPL